VAEALTAVGGTWVVLAILSGIISGLLSPMGLFVGLIILLAVYWPKIPEPLKAIVVGLAGLSAVFLVLLPVFSKIVGLFSALWTFSGFLAAIFEGGAITAGIGAIGTAMAAAAPFVLIAVAAIGTFAIVLAITLAGALTGILAFHKLWTSNWLGFRDNTTKILLGLFTAFTVIFSAIRKVIAGDLEGAARDIANFKDGVMKAWEDMKEDMLNPLGFEKSIDEELEGIYGKIKEGIININELLGIGSPSKVFQDIGKNMMAGMKVGIDRNAYLPATAMQSAGRSTVHNWYLNANYPYQSPVTLAQDVRLLEMMTTEA